MDADGFEKYMRDYAADALKRSESDDSPCSACRAIGEYNALENIIGHFRDLRAQNNIIPKK